MILSNFFKKKMKKRIPYRCGRSLAASLFFALFLHCFGPFLRYFHIKN
jgi:hypothetical protein